MSLLNLYLISCVSMNFEDIKLVLLDVDGVLRDCSKLTYESHSIALESYGLGADFRKSFGVEEIWHTKAIGKYNSRSDSLKAAISLIRDTTNTLNDILQKSDAEHILDQIVKKEITADDEAHMLAMCDIYYDFFNLSSSKELTSIYPWAEEAIEMFSDIGVEIGVFTNSAKLSLKRDLPRSMLDAFDVVLGIGDVSDPKPSGEGIRKAASLLGIKTMEILYAGDSTVDIDAARDAGSLSAAILSGSGLKIHLENKKPDIIYNNVLELSKSFTA